MPHAPRSSPAIPVQAGGEPRHGADPKCQLTFRLAPTRGGSEVSAHLPPCLATLFAGATHQLLEPAFVLGLLVVRERAERFPETPLGSLGSSSHTSSFRPSCAAMRSVAA